MAYDAGMVAAVASEIRRFATDARVEKIIQPEKDEIILFLHCKDETKKLSISASANTARVNFTSVTKESPQTPPMFCTLLRKHLSSAHLSEVLQPDFERVLIFKFNARDELGFDIQRYLIAEIMGKYSNLIFCDGNMKILGAVHPVDFSLSSKRQVLPGMKYELPPSQEKLNPLTVTKDEFIKRALSSLGMPVPKWILSAFCGISKLVASEICADAFGNADEDIKDGNVQKLYCKFVSFTDKIKNENFEPTLIYDDKKKPTEYSFLPITQYCDGYFAYKSDSVSEVIEKFFLEKCADERRRQRGADIFKFLSNTQGRIMRKTALQREELAECAKKDEYKNKGDIITASIYMIPKRSTSVSLPDYSKEDCPNVEIALDARLTPAQNAQRYYKLYNKAKRAECELTSQLLNAERELEYLRTVEESLSKSENESDLDEIRGELAQSGYFSRSGKARFAAKKHTPKPLKFITSGGYTVLCGKNNTQNDYISMKLAKKNDYWFHVKNMPGSHVILECDGKEEPDVRDFTEAAEIAAYYSKAKESSMVEVEYTLVKNLKKPPSSAPGYVIYHTNYSAVVDPKDGKLLNG